MKKSSSWRARAESRMAALTEKDGLPRRETGTFIQLTEHELVKDTKETNK